MADQTAPSGFLDQYRDQHPEYKQVDDETLTRGLYQAYPEYHSAMSFNDFAQKVGAKVTPPAAAASTTPAAATPPETTPLLTRAGHMVEDTAGAAARGVGQLVDTGNRLVHPDTAPAYGSPDTFASKFSAPFGHEPDAQPAGNKMPALRGESAVHGAVSDALDNPAGQFASDVFKPAADIATGALAFEGMRGAAGALHGAADTAINALPRANTAEAATVASNPQIGRMRSAGFKITPNDVRSKTNGPIPGPETSTPDVVDSIQKDNQAQSTAMMAKDVGLKNTRAIDPAEVEARKGEEAKTYVKVGEAIGNTNRPTPSLDHDISKAAPRSADPDVQAKIDKDVQFYRNEFAGDTFDGPKAVQTVRTLA